MKRYYSALLMLLLVPYVSTSLYAQTILDSNSFSQVLTRVAERGSSNMTVSRGSGMNPYQTACLSTVKNYLSPALTQISRMTLDEGYQPDSMMGSFGEMINQIHQESEMLGKTYPKAKGYLKSFGLHELNVLDRSKNAQEFCAYATGREYIDIDEKDRDMLSHHYQLLKGLQISASGIQGQILLHSEDMPAFGSGCRVSHPSSPMLTLQKISFPTSRWLLEAYYQVECQCNDSEGGALRRSQFKILMEISSTFGSDINQIRFTTARPPRASITWLECCSTEPALVADKSKNKAVTQKRKVTKDAPKKKNRRKEKETEVQVEKEQPQQEEGGVFPTVETTKPVKSKKERQRKVSKTEPVLSDVEPVVSDPEPKEKKKPQKNVAPATDPTGNPFPSLTPETLGEDTLPEFTVYPSSNTARLWVGASPGISFRSQETSNSINARLAGELQYMISNDTSSSYVYGVGGQAGFFYARQGFDQSNQVQQGVYINPRVYGFRRINDHFQIFLFVGPEVGVSTNTYNSEYEGDNNKDNIFSLGAVAGGGTVFTFKNGVKLQISTRLLQYQRDRITPGGNPDFVTNRSWWSVFLNQGGGFQATLLWPLGN